MTTTDPIAAIVGATRLTWTVDVITTPIPCHDEPFEDIQPGTYLVGIDPDKDEETEPAIRITVDALHGGDGPHAGENRSQAVAEALAGLLRGATTTTASQRLRDFATDLEDSIRAGTSTDWRIHDLALLLADIHDQEGAQDGTASVLAEVRAERSRQDAKWGQQNHPDGTGPDVEWLCTVFDTEATASELAQNFRAVCKSNGPDRDNYLDILLEEVAEAFAEDDPARLRAELLQVAAVAVQWVEAIDRRQQGEVAR